MTVQDAPAPTRTAPFRLGDRIVFPQRNRIQGPAGEVHLEPRVMDVLCVLAAESGNVLSRESLIDRVWAVQFGGDESVTRAISILRKALDAGAIETISKRGYRLTLPIEEGDPAALAARSVVAPVPTARLAAHAPSASEPAPAVQTSVVEAREPAIAPRSLALRQLGRGPSRMFPAASLDFWRLPPMAFAIAIALAAGIVAADVMLLRP